MKELLVVLDKDLEKFGCPNCGCCNCPVFSELVGGKQHYCINCYTSFLSQNPNSRFGVHNNIDGEFVIRNADYSGVRCSECLARPKFGEVANIIGTQIISTPGCFIGGGSTEERRALIIETSCKKAARTIKYMFEMGATYYDKFVIVGASHENRMYLYNLMLHIIATERIDSYFILKLQNEKRRQKNLVA